MNKKTIQDYATAQAQHLLDQRFTRPVEMKPYVCPLFTQKINSKVEPVGSAVLLQCADRQFLVTAAHVADEITERFMIPGPEKLISFNSAFRKTVARRGQIDKIDLAFTELKDATLNPAYSFWDISQCEADVKKRRIRDLIFVGYPLSRNKPKMSMKSINTEQRTYVGLEASDAEYSKLKITRMTHAVVRFTEGALTSLDDWTAATFPKPVGMSGGGVWSWDITSGTGRIEVLTLVPILTGIIIERRGRNKYWVATRINFFLEYLRAVAPELSQHIPVSNTFRLNVEFV